MIHKRLHRLVLGFVLTFAAQAAHAQEAQPSLPQGDANPAADDPAAPVTEPSTRVGSDPAAAPALPPEVGLPPAQGEPSAASLEEALAMLDPSMLVPAEDPTQVQPKLDIYGFADLTYLDWLVSDDNRWNGYIPRNSAFAIGNLNLYFRGTLSKRVRSLAEVRFTYLPNGAPELQADGRVVHQSTRVEDYLEFGRDFNWGGIAIERAWVEYELDELLTIQAGQFLTPYGIWNVDHGSPTIIAVRRPFVMTENLFPERQTGLHLYGHHGFRDFIGGYHLTLSNGRGTASEYMDKDDNKAFGGRLFASTRLLGELTGGVSWYLGTDVNAEERAALAPGGGVRFEEKLLSASTSRAVAFDLKWTGDNLHFQAEFVSLRTAYDDKARRKVAPTYTGFVPDSTRWGGYALLGYRTAWMNLMPYVLAGHASFAFGDVPTGRHLQLGLNLRPEPGLVVKLEYAFFTFPGALETSLGADDLGLFSAQVAWVF